MLEVFDDLTEASLDTEEEHTPPSEWPKHGIISGEQVSFAYSPDAPKVLKNLRFCIRAHEKVTTCQKGHGVCGFVGYLNNITCRNAIGPNL